MFYVLYTKRCKLKSDSPSLIIYLFYSKPSDSKPSDNNLTTDLVRPIHYFIY